MKVRWRVWLTLLLASAVSVLSEEVQEVIPTPTTTVRPPPEKCFYSEPKFCPDESKPCRCQKLENDSQAAVCCHISTSFELTEGLTCLCRHDSCRYVSRMHIYNATLSAFNIGLEQRYLKIMDSLAVTEGKIDRVIGDFPKKSSIKCLNFSRNDINDIDRRSFVHLHNLAMLDLSHNNLSEVPNFNKKRLISLDISHNGPLMCRSLMDVMNHTELHFVRDNETFCLFPKTFNWFNTTESIPLRQVMSYTDLEKKCSDNCTCKAHRLDLVPGKSPTFAVMVDCSGKQMTEMPTNLPPYTIALNISNNNISELRISNNANYEHLRELDADNNQITSILSLEGTQFLDIFVALSLRNNKLQTLPTYLLSNTFDRNSISRKVRLGLNRLQCDCKTAKNLKVWLLTRNKHIPDYNEILCDNIPNVRVIDLDQTKLCHQDQQEWTDYIYYIISAEVLLLICLVLKVSYDYWVFKTAGYLPWPASKMPKLPCDWLCE